MKLPVIKSLVDFIEKNDEDFVHEAVEVLEHLGQAKGIKEEEFNVICELLSNMHGSLEVATAIKAGTPHKEALNGFMERVMGSIDR